MKRIPAMLTRRVTHRFSEGTQNRFFCTMLARENQHELAVAARKFGNLMIFGCWWWLNNPSLVEEITRMRVELLGTTFIPQHSDARVLEQLVYKWEHSRAIIGKVLADQFESLARSGRRISGKDISRDVNAIFSGNVDPDVEKEAFGAGAVEVLTKDGSVVYATLTDGDFFGEIALVLNQTRTACVRTVSYCDLYRLDKEMFDRVLAHYPNIAAQIEAKAKERNKEW